RLTGFITEAPGGQPLAGVAVDVYDSTGVSSVSAWSDASGRYISDGGLPVGSYYVRTRNDRGFINQAYGGLICIGCDVTTTTPIAITDASVKAGIDFALTIGGRITGHVTAASDGRGLSGVRLDFLDSSGRTVASGWTYLGSYVSDAGLPGGTYFARTVNGFGYIDELFNNIPCVNCSAPNG